MKKLRILINSNAPFATSGYSMQVADFTPRMKKEGYEVAVVCFYGLDGGEVDWNGIKLLPKVDDQWGTDAVLYHSHDFKPDVTFSLQDIWVMNDQNLKQFTRWIPICVDGKTKVSFCDGREIPIKEVVSKKIDGLVWGYNGKKVVKTKIKAWQKIPYKMDVYELKTNKSKVLITGNNEVFVNGKWVRADCINKGDMVYLYNHEPYTTKKRGVGLFGRLIRWGRNNNNNESYEKEPKNRSASYNSPIYSDNKYRCENDYLGTRKNRSKNEPKSQKYWKQIQSFYWKVNSLIKDSLCYLNMGLQLSTNFKGCSTIFDNKKGSCSYSNRIYPIKNKTTDEEIQSTIFSKRNRAMGTCENIKPEVVLAIEKVKAPKRTVYDISTETGNFFANKILVHNCPIDHEPTPPAIREKLKLAYRIVTYSQFGHRQLQKEGFHSTYIPHTVNTDIFIPLDKSECRRVLSDWCGKQIPDDAFIVGMVAANKDMPPRKSFQEAMDAFKIFEQRKNAYMYLHTNLVSATGFPIMQYAKALGIEDKIFMTKDFVMRLKLKKENVPVLYNAFDLFLEPSTNEGFGVPIIEAQSCGIPTMCTDFTAMRDLVVDGVTGYKIEVAYPRFTQLLSYVGVPSVKSILDGMEKIYNVNRVKMGKKARKFIIDNYSLDLIWNTRWIPFLDKLEKEIYTQ
jgi:glycosyltransferase involved in cell wall biosynthesis